MYVRAAVTQVSAIFGLVFLLCGVGKAQQTRQSAVPAFDVKLAVSPEATSSLGSRHEKLYISVFYAGLPRPGIRANHDIPYVVSPKPGIRSTAKLGLEFSPPRELAVAAESQIVHIPEADASQIANISGSFYVEIRVAGEEPSLSCDTFFGRAAELSAAPVPLRCALKSEAKSNDIGLTPIPHGSAADSYAIYSLLLPGGSLDTISPTKARSWAVADTTVNITDMNPAVPPGAQLKEPPENKEAFEQALRDFKIRQYERFHLSASGFSGSKPELINQQQVRQIRASGQGGIVFFSAVYFNNNNTAALVFVNTWCANLCSAGQWVYLEKQGRQWVRRSGISEPGA